jgi:hypothetical protein
MSGRMAVHLHDLAGVHLLDLAGVHLLDGVGVHFSRGPCSLQPWSVVNRGVHFWVVVPIGFRKSRMFTFSGLDLSQ